MCILIISFCMLRAVPNTIPYSITKGRFPFRKIRIGPDFFPSCIIHTTAPKRVENTSTLYHPGWGSQVQTGIENWYRKPMREFSFVPIWSHAYFPESKSALTYIRARYKRNFEGAFFASLSLQPKVCSDFSLRLSLKENGRRLQRIFIDGVACSTSSQPPITC